MEGDDHDEAYTAILWGVGLSHEMNDNAGAEAFASELPPISLESDLSDRGQ